MSEDKYRNIAIAMLALTALILWLFKKSGNTVKLQSFIALALILGLTLIIPFGGMLLAIPIFLVVWFDHQKEVWAWWSGLKDATLNTGGKD